MSLIHASVRPLKQARWTCASSTTAVNAITRLVKRMNCPAVWHSSLGAILLSACIFFHSRQQKVAELEAALSRASTRLIQTEFTLKEYSGCISSLKSRQVQWTRDGAQVTTLIATVEELQAEAERARGKDDEIAALKQRIREYETLESGMEAQMLILSSKVEVLETSKTEEDSEEISKLKGQLRESEIRSLEKDEEITILKRRIKNQFDLELQMTGKDARIVALTSTVEERKLADCRREAEQEKEVSTLKARIQHLEVQAAESDARVVRCSSNNKLEADERIEISPRPEEAHTIGFQHQHRVILETGEAISKLAESTAIPEHSCRAKEQRPISISEVNKKQLERSEELESEVHALKFQACQLENVRAQEKEHHKRDTRHLRDSLIEANSLIVEKEDRIKELEVEADVKAKGSRPVLVFKEEKPTRARSTKSNSMAKPSKDRKLQKQLRSREEDMPEMQGRAQYEQKIAELTDRLAECHALLKAGGLQGPPTSTLRPPPYDTTTVSPGYSQYSIATCRADEFIYADTPLWKRLRSFALGAPK